MPRKITPQFTLDLMEDEVLFTTAALKADPDASDLVSVTAGWLATVDHAREKDRAKRTAVAEADAARTVTNARLDAVCVQFGDELFLAAGKDRESPRWKRFVNEPMGKFVRRAFRAQIAKVRSWVSLATGTEAVLDKYRTPLDTWSAAGNAALERTDATALARGGAQIARTDAAETLTRERDALHALLVDRANTRSLPRDWPATFFRTEPAEDDKPAQKETTPTP
jgi:hypothetical protein